MLPPNFWIDRYILGRGSCGWKHIIKIVTLRQPPSLQVPSTITPVVGDGHGEVLGLRQEARVEGEDTRSLAPYYSKVSTPITVLRSRHMRLDVGWWHCYASSTPEQTSSLSQPDLSMNLYSRARRERLPHRFPLHASTLSKTTELRSIALSRKGRQVYMILISISYIQYIPSRFIRMYTKSSALDHFHFAPHSFNPSHPGQR